MGSIFYKSQLHLLYTKDHVACCTLLFEKSEWGRWREGHEAIEVMQPRGVVPWLAATLALR